MSGQNSSSEKRRQRIRASAAWAAFGDALGFISELTDRRGVERRAGTKHLSTTVPWRRRIGGQFGPTLELPSGTISDDTQLRLATSRSIRPSGAFDVETFSAIELTVWPSYALGAGRGSLAAAASLRKRDVTWATNFFETRDTRYLDGGGNGAAMRIHPHVWAQDPLASDWSWLGDVLVNAIVTHGHARGFAGAVFHAACVDFALRRQTVPGPRDWLEIAESLVRIPDAAVDDDRLDELWRRQWERASGRTIRTAVEEVIAELRADIATCAELPQTRGSYSDAVESLKAFEPAQRGSGTKTALLAAVGAHLFADHPEDGIVTAADFVGTDTDSIATMQGAIAGAAGGLNFRSHAIQDLRYIIGEADRMWAASESQRVARFPYPDILGWRPPKSATDALASADDGPHLAGLGPCEIMSEAYETQGRSPARWQWVRLWFGQTVLAKRRDRPRILVGSQLVRPAAAYVQHELLRSGAPTHGGTDTRPARTSPRGSSAQTSVGRPVQETLLSAERLAPEPSLDAITDTVIQSGLSDEAIGAGLRMLASRERSIEDAIAYTAIIVKALSARDRRRRGA